MLAPSSPVISGAGPYDRGHSNLQVRGIIATLVAGIVALAVMLERAQLSVDFASPGTIAFGVTLVVAAVVRAALRHPRSRAARITRDLAEYLGLFIAVSLVGAIASYPVAAFGHGFVDASLYRMDLALHFNWLAWYEVVAAHPWVQVASRMAYAMIYVSPAILLTYLAITDKRCEAYDFIAAVGLSAAMTLLVFRFTPAVGPFGYLWNRPIPYLPVSDLWQPDLIPQLRAHVAPPVDPGHLVGLVSVPSFHAAAAVLLIAFALRHRPIRLPLLFANAAMLLATPVEGTHYLVDMIAGALIALCALGIIGIARNRRLSAAAPRLPGELIVPAAPR